MTAGDSICRQKFSKKTFLDWFVSYFQEKVGSTGMFSGEHAVHVGGGGGLDKATISMQCYFAASRSLAMIQSRFF